MDYSWLLVYILPSIGFVLALALLSHILRERRSPTSTLAWLMAVIFIPYLGVPLYLIFGGRKMPGKAEAKTSALPAEQEIPQRLSFRQYRAVRTRQWYFSRHRRTTGSPCCRKAGKRFKR